MKKKLVIGVAVGVLSVMAVLAGCGKKESGSGEETARETVAETEEKTEAQTVSNAEGMTEEDQVGKTEAQTAPDFQAELTSGETVSLSDYKGKKVLLNFWATWCSPCVGEMPALQKLSEEYPQELVVLAVNCGEDEATVKKFLEKNDYTFPIALDEENEIQSLYPGVLEGIPYTVILDEDGKVTEESLGASSADQMYLYYKEILELE